MRRLNRIELVFGLGLLMAAFALGVSARTAAAQEEGVVVWPYFSFPPYVVVDQNGGLSGISMDIQSILRRGMHDYHHVRVNSPFMRSMRAVEDGDDYCFTGLLRCPDRERLLLYSSVPCRLSPPQVVVARRGLLEPHKNDDGQVSLADLLENTGLVMGHMDGFSHGQALDRIISRNLDGKNVHVLKDMKTLQRQLKLLLSGRIQYFVTVPEQAWYAVRERELESELELVRIAEAREWVLGHVACSRGEKGREVIADVDRMLRGAVLSGELKAVYKRRLPPELWPEFDRAWERLMLRPLAEKDGEAGQP